MPGEALFLLRVPHHPRLAGREAELALQAMSCSSAGAGRSARRGARRGAGADSGRLASAVSVAGCERGRGERQTGDDESATERPYKIVGRFVIGSNKSTHRQVLSI
jgi:hypothetical protein